MYLLEVLRPIETPLLDLQNLDEELLQTVVVRL